VFGDVVQGMDVVMRIAQGDVIESVRIARVGAKAQAYHPTTESFRALREAALARVAEHAEKKRAAEREWLAANYPKAEVVTSGKAATIVPGGGGPPRVRYRGRQVRYLGHVVGRTGPALEVTTFASTEDGRPDELTLGRAFTPGKINPGLDGVISQMKPGERRTVVVPAEFGYGRSGFYGPDLPGKRRFAISPNVLLVYEVEALAN